LNVGPLDGDPSSEWHPWQPSEAETPTRPRRAKAEPKREASKAPAEGKKTESRKTEVTKVESKKKDEPKKDTKEKKGK